MRWLLPMLTVLSVMRISVLTITSVILIQSIFGVSNDSIIVWLNICLGFIIIHMCTEIIRFRFVKDTRIILTLFSTGFWIVFINFADLKLFMVDNTYRLQEFVSAVTLAIILPYLYQNLGRVFSVFQRFKLGYRLIVTLSFLLVIAIGTILLMLPISLRDEGTSLRIVDAFFTATSAVCVTGLTVVDTATYFSRFGQVIILVLIQIGSLGLVTITTSMVALLGRKISQTNRLSAQSSLSALSDYSLMQYIAFSLIFTFIFELIIAIPLFIKFYRLMPLGDSIFYALFFAISSFCNAGFSLFTDSLESFRADFVVNITIMISIFVGGLGFGTWLNIQNNLTNRRSRPLSLQTKVALNTSLILAVAGAVGFFILERDASLKDFSVYEKTLASMFASVNMRTAGFNTINLADTKDASRLMSVVLMYIGAAPGSTGGGIKTTTFVVLIAYARASLANHKDITLYGKRIEESIAHQAWTLVFYSIAWICLVTIILCYVDNLSLSQAMYETVSAYATVGLGLGITPELSTFSKLLLCATMILGRVGPTTIMLALARGNRKSNIVRGAAEKMSIG